MRVLALFLSAFAAAPAVGNDLATLVEDGRWREARAIVEQGAGASARDLALAAKVRLAYGEVGQAAELAEKAAALDTRCAECHYLLFEAYGTMAQRASILRQPGLARKCRKAVDQAIALDPRHVEAQIGLMMYLYQAPGLFGGDKIRARAIPDEVARFDPARGHLVKARLAMLTGEGKLREHYRAAVNADPALVGARLALAADLSRREPLDLAEAVRHAREAVRLKPGRSAGWEALAFALARQGDGAGVAAALAEMRKALPNESAAHYRAAEGFLVAGKELGRAEEYLRLYRAQPSPGPDRPTHANAEWRLAQVYEKTGRKHEAVAAYEQAARANPKNEEIQKALKRLRG